jgi:two-component system OmpR family response regulator
MRLLLLEDDAILGEGLRDYLRSEGHVVDWFMSLRDLQAVAGEPYDAWLLDWQLPDGSGLDWLARQRQAGLRTQAFLLTARDRLADRVLGSIRGRRLPGQALRPAELAARLRVLQRRGSDPTQALRCVGGITLDLPARCATLRAGAWN